MLAPKEIDVVDSQGGFVSVRYQDVLRGGTWHPLHKMKGAKTTIGTFRSIRPSRQFNYTFEAEYKVEGHPGTVYVYFDCFGNRVDKCFGYEYKRHLEKKVWFSLEI